MDFIQSIDGDILLWLQNNLRRDWLTEIFKGITWLGSGAKFWIAITIILLFVKKYRSVGVMSMASLFIANLINNFVLKLIIRRTRPYEVVEGLESAIGKMNSFSFPSGHSAVSMAVATVMICKMPKRYGIPSMIVAVAIVFSRLYLGVHYPTDVIAGSIVGALSALISIKAVDVIIEKKKLKMAKK